MKMGICINYALVRHETPEYLLKEAEKRAVAMGMEIRARSWNHLLIHPAEGCETLNLHFHKWKTIKAREDWSLEKAMTENYVKELHEDDWVCAGFTKTQYASIECHVKVAELLRFVASHCRLSEIYDEAGYYEAGDAAALERASQNFKDSAEAIAKIGEALKKAFGAGNVISGADLAR